MEFLLKGSAVKYSELGRVTSQRDLVKAFLLEHQRVALDLADHAIAGDKVAFEDPLRERVLDLRLDRPLQGPRAVHRIESGFADLVARIIV